MKLDVLRKVMPIADLSRLRQACTGDDRSIVLCHGCFDIVHPGHLRYLQFARSQGDLLVVSLTGDDAIEKSDGTRPHVPQELRAESLAALEFVDHVVIADHPTAEPIVRQLKPDVYIKGQEYEHSTDPRFLSEKTLVESQGGRVIYSSGEVVYSSTAIVESMFADDRHGQTRRLAACCQRWGLDHDWARQAIGSSFIGKRIAVIGDAMMDRYVMCDAGEVAGEAPVLSVRPMEEMSYPGGAAIVAAHLKALGATPHLLTTVADDHESRQLLHQLDQLNIDHTAFATRPSLPMKLRYLVETQKLLKVDRGAVQPLDSATQKRMLSTLDDLAQDLDGIIFTDFGCGTLTIPLLTEAMALTRDRVDVITGDVSGARRTLMAMRQADLLTPTERELRGVLGDFEQSLPTLAHRVMHELRVANLAVTMGRRGAVLFRPREADPAKWFTGRLRSEYIPALASVAVDPVGAGDAFLAAATLILCTGGSLMQAGYVGSASSAVTVNRLGNQPVTREDLLHWLASRPELAAARVAEAS